MASTNTPNMSLTVPGVGTEAGPDYAIEINSDLVILDSHNHSPGSGVQITPDGLNLNAALTLNNNFLTDVAGMVLLPRPSLPSTVSTVYQSGVDLYFVDGSGNNIRLTQSGGIAGSPGSISGLVSPASATYVSVPQTFVWQSGTSVAANMDFGAAILRNLSPNSTFALTLQPPNLTFNYTITLPTLPTAPAVVTMSTAGVLSTQPATYLMPVGAVTAYMGTSAPTGYLLCNGTAVSRTVYSALFAVLGISNGQGDGTTTFNLPDMRGMFLRGVDNGRGLDPNATTRSAAATGGNIGDNVGSVQADEFESHTHANTLTDPGHGHAEITYLDGIGSGGISPVGSESAGPGARYGAVSYQGVQPNTTGVFITNVNTGGAETRPVNTYVNYIIKT